MKRFLMVGGFCLLCLPGISLAQAVKIKLSWKTPIEILPYRKTPMAVYEQALYYNNAKLDIRSGKTKQEYKGLFGNRFRTIRLAEGVMLIASEECENEEESHASYDSYWSAFDLKTGKCLWNKNKNSQKSASVLLEISGQRALLVEGTEHDRLSALDIHSGKYLWTKADINNSQPTFTAIQDLSVSDERIFLQTENLAAALSPADGKLLWEKKLPGTPREPMALGQNKLFINRTLNDTDDSVLIALDQATGKIVWKINFVKEDLFPALYWRGMLFFIVQPKDLYKPGRLLALACRDGKEKWRAPAVPDYGENDFQPAVFNDKLVLWSGDAKYLLDKHTWSGLSLHCFNPWNGKQEWNYRPPVKEKEAFSHPVPLGNGIFFNDQEDVYCIDVSGASDPRLNPYSQ